MASNYVKKMEEAEIKKFDREMTRRKLQKVLAENETAAAVRKHYRLTTEESQILDELEAEQAEQAKHDKAFLAGWNSGGTLYE